MVEVVVAAVAGLLIGSFANRLIVREPGYRILDPKDLPDDADPALLDELEELDEVPAVPLLVVVRGPRAWSPRWLPLVEVVMALGWALTVDRYGTESITAAVLVLVTALVTLGAVDFRVYRIPDRLNFPAIGIGLASIVAVALVEDATRTILGAVIGALVYVGFLFAAHMIHPRGMGWGDVKLAWLMGFYLGWVGYVFGPSSARWIGAIQFVLWGAALGSVLGLVIGLPYALRKKSTNTVFPYGPSLAMGCAAVVLFAADIAG